MVAKHDKIENMDQVTLLRRLTPRVRMEQAFKLSDFVRELALINIRENKRLSRKQAVKELYRRQYEK